jgi:hypothetical protein
MKWEVVHDADWGGYRIHLNGDNWTSNALLSDKSFHDGSFRRDLERILNAIESTRIRRGMKR